MSGNIDEYKNKLEKANENIYKLITELVDTREAAVGSSTSCPYQYFSGTMPCKGKSISCNTCKDEYFDKLHDKFIEQYIVE